MRNCLIFLLVGVVLYGCVSPPVSPTPQPPVPTATVTATATLPPVIAVRVSPTFTPIQEPSTHTATPSPQPPTATPQPPSPTPEPTLPAIGGEIRGSADPAAIEQATRALLALRQRDMKELAAMAQTDGIRFAPYSGLRETDLVIPAEQIASLYEDNTLHSWGVQDGTGDPIKMTFRQFYERYIYGVEYVSCDVVGLNQRVAITNQVANITDYYPDATIIEYHFTGFDDAYGGMDWQSLILVLRETEDGWRVAAVINDEWTI